MPEFKEGRENHLEDNFDQFVQALQSEINADMRRTYGEVAFQRWQQPLYMGRIPLADGYARLTGSCGDTMEVFLRFENGRVKEATFLTDGCAGSVVCGSFAAELAMGKSPEELQQITGETILEILGNLPEEDRHCAFLAVETLQKALEHYMKLANRKNPTNHPLTG